MTDMCWVLGLIPGLEIGLFLISWGESEFCFGHHLHGIVLRWPCMKSVCICVYGGVVMISDCEATFCPASLCLGVAGGSLGLCVLLLTVAFFHLHISYMKKCEQCRGWGATTTK